MYGAFGRCFERIAVDGPLDPNMSGCASVRGHHEPGNVAGVLKAQAPTGREDVLPIRSGTASYQIHTTDRPPNSHAAV